MSVPLDNPFLYGMPILFPVNRIENGSFQFEGREYKFPVNEPSTGCHLHGTLHEAPFTLAHVGESKVVCTYESGDYFSVPHTFRVTAEYKLTENGLLHTVRFTNLSNQNMPFFLGFHTTFNTCFCDGANSDGIRVFAEIAEEYERIAQNFLPTGRKLYFDEVSEKLSHGEWNPHEKLISRHYLASGNKLILISDTLNMLSVVYEVDEKLAYRLIYGGGESGFICLEPQSCLVNCQNAGDRNENGFDFIEAGKSKIYTSKLYLREDSK